MSYAECIAIQNVTFITTLWIFFVIKFVILLFSLMIGFFLLWNKMSGDSFYSITNVINITSVINNGVINTGVKNLSPV